MVFAQQQNIHISWCMIFTESIDKQNHCSAYYNKLLYVCGGEGYCGLLGKFTDFLFIIHAILLF